MCAIPLALPIVEYPAVGFSMLAALILLFWGLLKLFGTGFVVEGGCIVMIIAVLILTISPAYYASLYGTPEDVIPDANPVAAVVLAALVVVFLSLGFSLVRDIRRDIRRDNN